MTIYLRTRNNETVADIEVFETAESIEVRSVILLPQYSKILLSIKDKKTCIEDFDRLSELRGWYWEEYKRQNQNIEIDELINVITSLLEYFCKVYSLNIVTD